MRMSKKKVQHKGKPKQATKESEDFAFRKDKNEVTKEEEEGEEEYTTVADFESKRKYSKRFIESNWSKYEASVSDFHCENEEDEAPKLGDFNDLIKMTSSDCSHFQFNSEKNWRSEDSMPSSKIFNLDLNVLSSGLACVPFYERMGLDKNELSAEDIKRFDKAAENSWKEYNTIREKLSKKPESDSEEKHSKSASHNLEDSLRTKLDLAGKGDKGQKSGAESDSLSTKSKQTEDDGRKDKLEINKQKIFLSETDENLEDWLDSVLDD